MKRILCITLSAFVLTLVPFAYGADASDVRGAQLLPSGPGVAQPAPAKKSHSKKHHKKKKHKSEQVTAPSKA